MKAAKMIVPSLTPKTESIKYPPMTGRITFGHEYQEYRLENSEVVIFSASFSYEKIFSTKYFCNFMNLRLQSSRIVKTEERSKSNDAHEDQSNDSDEEAIWPNPAGIVSPRTSFYIIILEIILGWIISDQKRSVLIIFYI